MTFLRWLDEAADELLAIDLENADRQSYAMPKVRYAWCLDCDQPGVVTPQDSCERCGSESVLHVRAGKPAA